MLFYECFLDLIAGICDRGGCSYGWANVAMLFDIFFLVFVFLLVWIMNRSSIQWLYCVHLSSG